MTAVPTPEQLAALMVLAASASPEVVADTRSVIPAAHLRLFADLRGHTLAAVAHETDTDGHERILFTLADGRQYELHHIQECCETVHVEDIEGDLGSLVGSPLLVAEEVEGETGGEQGFETYTWTFYKLATIRGYVDIRWFGSSNGYYSESVDFHRVTESGR